MLKNDWLKIAILIIIPINAWLGIFYYLHQKTKNYPYISHYRDEELVRVNYFAEKWGIREGQQLIYPFPIGNTPTIFLGDPPVRQGRPVLFLNISWIASKEVWEPTLQEALKISSSLHIVLLFDVGESSGKEFDTNLKRIKTMLQYFSSRRISVIAGDWIGNVFGGFLGGILAFLCDGNGVVQAVELYPKLKISPYWEEEVKDWRPKLHQAVKKVLDKFFKQEGKSVK